MERNTPSSSSSERNPSPDQLTLNAREEKGNKTVGEGREATQASHAIGSDGREVDVPQLKNFRPLPGVLYFLSYGTREDLMLYTIGLLGALGCGLPFAAIDLLYGHWTSGLVPRTYTATPNDIRSVSSFVAEMMIAVAICMWIFSSIFFYCFGLASSRVSARIRRAYLSSILNMPAAYFETIGSGEVASRMVRDIGLVQVGVGERLGFLMWSASSFVTGIIVAFYSAPKVAGVIFSIVPFSAILFYGSGAFSSRATDRMSKSEGSASSFLEQILSSIRIVKVFQAGDALTRVYDRHLERIESDGRFVAVAKGVAFAASYFGIFTSYALSFWYGGGRVANNGLDVGKLVTCFFSMFNAMFAIVNILPHITSMYEALIAQNRIRAEIERVSAIDPRDPRGISDLGASGGSSEKGRGGLEIELRNVTFSFPSRPTRKALDDVSILIPAGEVVALVGASGSGKSTMTSLLLRQYDVPDPNSHTNNIFIGDHPVSSVRISHLRDQIAICAQDPVLFAASILENVAVGLTGTSNELRLDKSNLEVVRGLCQEALRKAQALTFVEKLPQGMDSVISGGKTGVLSGGQKQRIAIARALVRRPRVLIMDEGTSALDSQTEARVQQAITEEQKLYGMTVILIAHRLSTVRYAHKIVVLSNGNKLEEGSHDDLLSHNGAYARMIRLHHGVVPGDETELQPSTTAPSSTYNPTPADLKAAVSTNYNSAPPTSTHPAGLPTAINNNELMGIRSRPGPGTHEYSMTITNAEEAKASVEAAEKETSEATKKARWWRFFAYVLEQKWWIFSGGIASCLIGCSFPVSGVLTGVVVHSLSNPDGDTVARESSRWALWFFVVALLNLVFCVVEGWFLENGAQRITRKMRRDGTEAILQQEVAWFEGEDNGAGGLTAAVGTHPSQVAGALGLVLGRLLVSIVNILGSIGVGFFYSWNLALVGLAPCLILIPAGYFEIRYLEKFETEGEKPLGRATSYATDVVDASKTIASFGRESRVVAEFDKMQQPNVKKHARLLLMGSIWFGLGQAMIPVIVALVFWYGGHELSRGSIGITQLYASFEAVIIGAFSASRLFSYVGDISRATHSFSAFNTWIERRPLVAKIEGRRLLGEKASSNKQGASIVFKDVELIYPSRPRPAINGLNLAIAPGETIAFCGPSGGGKSSILALLARFYEPSRGTISVNGEDIRACDSIEDHYSKLALVSQDATLYEGTVAFNLTLGLTRQVPEDELRQACIDANCMDFILALDGGFDAEIGLKGLSLSGGQRQRLCIARALLRDAQILLLDEATSALDNESEALVQAALDRASVGRTTITIAHRLSTIRGADRIIVVEDGTIVESGSHEELLKKNGRYVELVEAQL